MSEISTSLQRHVEGIQNSIKSGQDLLEKLRKIYTKFPDLSVAFLRYSQIYLAESANPIVDEIDYIEYSDEIYVEFFHTYNGMKIYSNPMEFPLTQDGEVIENWKEFLIEAKISSVVIDMVNLYVEKLKGNESV